MIGVLSIIYGILGLFANGCNALWPWAQDPMLSMAGLKNIELPSGLSIMTMVGGVVGIALAVVLLIAGFGVMRRRASGFRLLRIWVIIKVIEGVVGVGLGFMFMDDNVAFQASIQDAMLELVKDRGGDVNEIPVKSTEEITNSAVLTLIIAAPVVLAFPIVIGLLGTKKRWQEEVAGWGTEVA